MAESVEESNFEDFLKKYVKSSKDEMNRTNKMSSFKEYLDDPNCKLGQGAFGKVYKVKDNGIWRALKTQYQDNFEDFAKVFIETSFHLLFPKDVPLIPLLDMFVQQNDLTLEFHPFTINLLMEKG